MNRAAGNLSILFPTLLSSAKIARARQYRDRIASAFLFLQGPPGPLLHQLATAMRGVA